jgi:hypothetical protein
LLEIDELMRLFPETTPNEDKQPTHANAVQEPLPAPSSQTPSRPVPTSSRLDGSGTDTLKGLPVKLKVVSALAGVAKPIANREQTSNILI